MSDQRPNDPVRTIPWGVLASTPRNLPPQWQNVFEVFKAPVLIASGLFYNAELMERTEEELRAKYRFLHPAFSALSAMLDNLDVIAPQSWKAGYAIRKSLWHAWAILEDFETMDMLGNPITPAFLDATRKRLVELKPNFDAAALLLVLREAVTAEHAIALPEHEAANTRAQLNNQPADPDITVVGKWRIEPGDASYNGTSLPNLEHRHRRLLRPLVESPGRTVTMTTLRLYVNEQVADKDNAIRSYISAIRKAIRSVIDVPNPIEDQDGRGYRLTLL